MSCRRGPSVQWEETAVPVCDQKVGGLFRSFQAKAGGAPYGNLAASPWGNELIELFAEPAVTGEKSGQRGPTDLLTVSFSSNDYVGHRVGPDAPEVRDMAVRTDQLLGKFFHRHRPGVGMKNVMVVLSADHGVASTPEHDRAAKMPGGYLSGDVEDVVTSALNRKIRNASWLIRGTGKFIVLQSGDARARQNRGRPADPRRRSVSRGKGCEISPSRSFMWHACTRGISLITESREILSRRRR